MNNRQSIIEKINNIQEESDFTLTESEMCYILRNWLETHTRHKVEELEIDADMANIVFTDVVMSKTKLVQY